MIMPDKYYNLYMAVLKYEECIVEVFRDKDIIIINVIDFYLKSYYTEGQEFFLVAD